MPEARVRRGRLRGPRQRHPARLIVFGVALAVLVGTVLLLLPDPQGAPSVTAPFTSTSAACVTGLTVVDTPVYWSAFGLHTRLTPATTAWVSS